VGLVDVDYISHIPSPDETGLPHSPY
jgi:hypothetical protein